MDELFITKLLELEEHYLREKGIRTAVIQKILKLLEEVWVNDPEEFDNK